MTHLIDGKKIAAELNAALTNQISALKQNHNITPGLAVILIGDDAASQIYVNNKKKTALKLGMHSEIHLLKLNISQESVEQLINNLNHNPNIHGILLQMPIPKHLKEDILIEKFFKRC